MTHKIIVIKPSSYPEGIFPTYDIATLDNIYIGKREDGLWEVVRRDPRFKHSIGTITIYAVEKSLFIAYLRALWHTIVWYGDRWFM